MKSAYYNTKFQLLQMKKLTDARLPWYRVALFSTTLVILVAIGEVVGAALLAFACTLYYLTAKMRLKSASTSQLDELEARRNPKARK